MHDSRLNRRLLLKLSGSGVFGGVLATSSASAQEGDTGGINDLTGFETPQPITNGGDQFQLITPANRLTIDAETDDVIDLVFEWDDSVTVDQSGLSVSGSGILLDQRDIGEQRAIFRGNGRENIVYDRLSLSDLNTSFGTLGDEVLVEVSARQADSPADAESFDDVVATVDSGEFDAEVTTEATFELTQGTLIRANDEATTDLDLAAGVDHTIAFDIQQLRDENAPGTPAGPAKSIIINYFIDREDGLSFDLTSDNVNLGGAAANLDLEVVKSREIPEIGQILLEIAESNTLEDDANLEIDDTVTVELSGLDTASVSPDEVDEFLSSVEVGLHGAATFDPIVSEMITPDRGAYTTDTVDFEFGEQTQSDEDSISGGENSTSDDEDDRSVAVEIPGFGVSSTLAALGSAGYMVKRRLSTDKDRD